MIVGFIVDDITQSVQRQRDWETPGGIAPLAECMFMGQKYDMGVIYITHTLSGTGPLIRQNAETIIAKNLSGENPRLICDTFNVTPEQADRTKTLRRKELVIINRALWDQCVLASFEKPQIPGKLQEPERRQTVKRFLAKVKACAPASMDAFRPAPSAPTAETNGGQCVEQKLTSADIQMLVHIVTGTPRSMCKIYEVMTLSRTQGRRIATRLESIGAIILHAIATGKRGGRLLFPEATDFGWQILAGKGIRRPAARTNGTFLHELAACLIEAWERKQSRITRFEVDVGGKRVDGLSIDRVTGAKIIWQIGASSPIREADSIEAILRLPVAQTSKFVFVARDAKFAKEVQKLLKDKDPSGNLLRQIEIKTIADFVQV